MNGARQQHVPSALVAIALVTISASHRAARAYEARIANLEDEVKCLKEIGDRRA